MRKLQNLSQNNVDEYGKNQNESLTLMLPLTLGIHDEDLWVGIYTQPQC